MKNSHSPLPWELHGDSEGRSISVGVRVDSKAGKLYREVAVLCAPREMKRVSSWAHDQEVKSANAQLIVTAVNHHDELVKVLRRYMKATDDYYRHDPSPETVGDKCAEMVLADEQARAVLAKLEGAK